MTNLLAEALAWWNRGYTPLPVKPGGSKAPAVASWKQHQSARPDADCAKEAGWER